MGKLEGPLKGGGEDAGEGGEYGSANHGDPGSQEKKKSGEPRVDLPPIQEEFVMNLLNP